MYSGSLSAALDGSTKYDDDPAALRRRVAFTAAALSSASLLLYMEPTMPGAHNRLLQPGRISTPVVGGVMVSPGPCDGHTCGRVHPSSVIPLILGTLVRERVRRLSER